MMKITITITKEVARFWKVITTITLASNIAAVRMEMPQKPFASQLAHRLC